jgi:hypothetical protein
MTGCTCAAAKALAAALAAAHHITHLLLPRCGIKHEAVAEMADGLGRCVSLTHVDLSHNKVGDAGAAALGGALAGCAQLQLQVGGGGAGIVGAGMLLFCWCTRQYKQQLFVWSR